MQLENRLKKLELALPEKIKNRKRQQEESRAKVEQLLSMRVYSSPMTRERLGIRDPMSEAIDRFWMKKDKEREENSERQRLARLGREQPELRSPGIEAAADKTVSCGDELASSPHSNEPTVGSDTTASNLAPNPRNRPRPPAVRSAPPSIRFGPPGKDRSLGSAEGRYQTFLRQRRFMPGLVRP